MASQGYYAPGGTKRLALSVSHEGPRPLCAAHATVRGLIPQRLSSGTAERIFGVIWALVRPIHGRPITGAAASYRPALFGTRLVPKPGCRACPPPWTSGRALGAAGRTRSGAAGGWAHSLIRLICRHVLPVRPQPLCDPRSRAWVVLSSPSLVGKATLHCVGPNLPVARTTRTPPCRRPRTRRGPAWGRAGTIREHGRCKPAGPASNSKGMVMTWI